MATNERLGTKLGPRIAMLVSQALVYTHQRLVHVKHALAMRVFNSISDMISDEVDITMGPLFGRMLEGMEEDHPHWPLLNFMHTFTGQLKAAAGMGLQISGLLGSISTIMNNELAAVVYANVASNPHLLPDPATLLQMSSAGLITQAEAVQNIGAQGISSGWANNMATLSYSYPSPPDGLEMQRRGLATRDDVALWCRLNQIPDNVTQRYLQMLNQPVSVADAALAVLRGNVSQSEGEQIAAETGYDQHAFGILIGNTGEPPGTQELLEGYRRGFITRADLERGILQSRYRNEWIPLLEQLRYSPMSVANAVDATVQNHLDPAQAAAIADQNGLEPGAFQVLLDTAGEPLSRTELEELFNRGLIDQAAVEQGLRESRLKNKYNTLAFDLHRKILPVHILQAALRRGAVTVPQATAAIMEQGYSKEDAASLISEASLTLLDPYINKIVSTVESMYENSLIDKATAVTAIASFGFTDKQAAYIAQGADLRKEAKIIQTAVGVIRTKYLSHHVDKATASGLLDQAQIPAGERDTLLAVWEIEAGAYTRTLTEAQVIKAVKSKLITEQDGGDRLLAMGYNQVDAGLLLKGA